MSANGWQTIETAPKDKEVIVWTGSYMATACRCLERFQEPNSGRMLDPTHWQPLPEPPS